MLFLMYYITSTLRYLFPLNVHGHGDHALAGVGISLNEAQVAEWSVTDASKVKPAIYCCMICEGRKQNNA